MDVPSLPSCARVSSTRRAGFRRVCLAGRVPRSESSRGDFASLGRTSPETASRYAGAEPVGCGRLFSADAENFRHRGSGMRENAGAQVVFRGPFAEAKEAGTRRGRSGPGGSGGSRRVVRCQDGDTMTAGKLRRPPTRGVRRRRRLDPRSFQTFGTPRWARCFRRMNRARTSGRARARAGGGGTGTVTKTAGTGMTRGGGAGTRRSGTGTRHTTGEDLTWGTTTG